MANQNQRDDRSTTDQILDLLLDALAERQKARRAEGAKAPAPRSPGPKPSMPDKPPVAEKPVSDQPPAVEKSVPAPRPEPPAREQQRPITAQRSLSSLVVTKPPPEPEPGEAGWQPPPRQPSIDMGKMIGRLAILVVVLLILVNIPVTQYGVSLARILPETTSLIIRDGLILKGSGPEIYKLEDNQLRWISSMDAFEHLGLTWGDVHVVEDAFLEKFEVGRPIHVVLKCQASPHIYRLENNQKRWIRDIDTFEAEGHKWEDVRFVSCEYLRNLPTGPSIPEDAGPAPEP
jgi:hypothetical protein